MIKYGRKTSLGPEAVLDEAVAYFGPQGLQLDVIERNGFHVDFRGADGFVTVQAYARDDGTQVDVSARQWEQQAKEFIGKL